ncbi:MAG: hypothetical protein ICV73_28920 [Acetobacteraceae bacterium]|nr:hypothetical protein [Acetobacteraceae bacterium]
MARFRAALVAAAVLAGAGGAGAAPLLAFSNSTDPDKAYRIDFVGPSPIVGVTLLLDRPSDVLVQFTSGATAETTEGCPCSVGAFLRMDGGALLPVKRINLGSRAATTQAGHVRDRQSLDGSLVFPAAEAGPHTFELVAQQVSGRSVDLRIYHPNLQAIAFPR